MGSEGKWVSVSSRATWSTKQVVGQSKLYGKILSQELK